MHAMHIWKAYIWDEYIYIYISKKKKYDMLIWNAYMWYEYMNMKMIWPKGWKTMYAYGDMMMHAMKWYEYCLIIIASIVKSKAYVWDAYMKREWHVIIWKAYAWDAYMKRGWHVFKSKAYAWDV